MHVFSLHSESCTNTKGGKRWHTVIFPRGNPAAAMNTQQVKQIFPTAERAIAAALDLGALPDVDRAPQ